LSATHTLYMGVPLAGQQKIVPQCGEVTPKMLPGSIETRRCCTAA